MIPIFDSLTHPTLSGKWLTQNIDASMQKLLTMMEGDDVKGFCAVGLSNTERYDHREFFDMVKVSNKGVAIAGFNPFRASDIERELKFIKSLGYKAIKLHPRIGGYTLDAESQLLIKCFKQAVELDLIIFLCTYISSALDGYPNKDPYWELVRILKKFPNTRCVLLHGGVTQLLKYAELVRFNKNLLLDLSFTIIKFKNSSLDLDIQYLFKTLDQRICIGTDYPEFTMRDLRLRLQDFETSICSEKLKNIYYKNLQIFLGINT